RFKFRFGGKEKLLALGVYPETSLREARMKADEARIAIRGGADPSLSRRIEKLARRTIPEDTFRAIAEDWHRQRVELWAPEHRRKILRRLENDIFPQFGDRSVKEITTPELLAVLRQIEARGAINIAHWARACCSQIFRYAISIGKAERDIAADLRGALRVRKIEHHPRLEEQDLPQFLADLEIYSGHAQTKTAIKLLLLTFVRTTELRAARWPELDFEKKIWEIPAKRMKMREKHLVPLSRQAVALLEEQKVLTGNMPYVFPHRNDPRACMSHNALLKAFYHMGYHSRATPHGIRATANTI
ncbi:MAG TPA: tyrosine-type recombinase/integrase, partial [Bacteroidia bacterium]|nr:tyrosine-type recombinase/integrase [Bacteroidia bacterium]